MPRPGKTKWETPRDEKTSWNTPLVVEHKGKTQVIVNGDEPRSQLRPRRPASQSGPARHDGERDSFGCRRGWRGLHHGRLSRRQWDLRFRSTRPATFAPAMD